MPGNKVTVKDIAGEAHVAVSKVSRVFNGSDRVNSETGKRVQETIKKLGYVQNPFVA